MKSLSMLLGVLFVPYTLMQGPHDLTRPGTVWIPNAPPLCQVCHMPHNGMPLFLLIPVRTLQPTLFVTNDVPPSPRNLACLRCHTDRITLTKEVPNIRGNPDARQFLGRDLRDDHPIDIPAPPEITSLDADTGPRLITDAERRVLCVTCHDAHRSTFPALLRMPVADLCRQCHVDATTHAGQPVNTCDDCHRMHATQTARLILPNATSDRCRQCHVQLPPAHPTVSPASPPKTVSGVRPQTRIPEIDRDARVRRAMSRPSPPALEEPGGCWTCHPFHQSVRLRGEP